MPPRDQKQATPKAPPPTPELETSNKAHANPFEDPEAAKAELEELRDRIRTETLIESDRRGWCEDGTRSVLAKMRIKSPGKERKHFQVTVPVTLMLTESVTAWIPEGAVLAAKVATLNVESITRLFRGYSKVEDVEIDEAAAIATECQ